MYVLGRYHGKVDYLLFKKWLSMMYMYSALSSALDAKTLQDALYVQCIYVFLPGSRLSV